MAPARVLVRLPNWLGDTVMARPLLHAIRARWPAAKLLGVGPASSCTPLAGDVVLDETIDWPRDAAGRAAALRRARAWAPELAFVLPASFSSAWLAWRAGARDRVGYRGEWRDALLTEALPRAPRGERHLSEEFLDLGRSLGLSEGRVPLLRPTAVGESHADLVFKNAGVEPGERVAILGPRSAYGPAREWFPDRFVEAGRELVRRGLRVLICGTATERESCDGIARDIGDGATSIAGETSLPALVAIAARARLALCNDSGLAHVAAATGTPTIQVYGSAASGWTAARGPHVRVLHRAPVCSPCWRRTCVIGTRCLDAVRVPWVMRHADELLAEAG